jgi:transposase
MGSRLCGGRPMQRFGLRDDQWERIKDLLPGREGHVGGNAADNRLFVDAVLYRYRTGVPWRDSPARFGDWNIVYQRFNRWRCEVHHKEQVAPAENRAARCWTSFRCRSSIIPAFQRHVAFSIIRSADATLRMGKIRSRSNAVLVIPRRAPEVTRER